MTTKLKGRLSKGEKTNRKRMAEGGAVYTVTPVPRSATDVMAHRDDGPPKVAPEATCTSGSPRPSSTTLPQ